MKQLLIFIGGMAAGALFLYAIGFRTESSVKEQIARELIESISQNLGTQKQEAEIQYIEVKGKKGNVTLHTGMSKDSVKILLGKPGDVRLNTIGRSTYETWGYKLNNKYVPDLEINLVDGKLEGVRQN